MPEHCLPDIFLNHILSMDYISLYSSPLGSITLASDGNSLTGLWFDGQKHFAATLTDIDTRVNDSLPIFAETTHWLDEYFSGRNPGYTPPLSLHVTPFRQRVYDILLTIPYGHTTTYGKIARRIALEKGMEHMSAQAVGSAIGRNPISIIIPCHRVTGADGSLTGYAGGIERKRRLLAIEHSTI